MSDEPKAPRKPRFYRADAGFASDRAPATTASPASNERAQQPTPDAAPEPERPAREPTAQAHERTAAAENGAPKAPPPDEPVLHQPQEKRRREPPPEPDTFEETDDEADATLDSNAGGRSLPTLKGLRRGFRWSAILLSALGGLASMAFISWLSSFVSGLIARNDWIGWLAFGLAAIAVIAVLAIILRELIGLMRLNKLTHIHERASRALLHDDRKLGEMVQKDLAGLFAGRRPLAWGLAAINEVENEVLSARDRLRLIERHLIAPLDKDANRIVADAAKRVSVLTAISPFAFLDMALVAIQNVRMLHRLMALYGGRPGVLSQFKMIQMMIANLALTGGIAVGADLLGHVMGRQVATRLAGRVGEGMINGSLTARLGITAMKLIRPLPYIDARPVSVSTFVKQLTAGSKTAKPN